MAGESTPYQVVLYTIVTPVVGAFILLLNSTELYCIVKLQKRQIIGTNSFIYMTSLCVSDIMAGIIMIVLKTMDPFMKTSLKKDKIAQEIYLILRFVFIRISLFLSILNLFALTLDRYFAVKIPIQYRLRKNSYHHAVIASVWIVSFVSVAISYCITRWILDNHTEYHELLFPISSYPTSVAFIICYYSIYKVIKNRKVTCGPSGNNNSAIIYDGSDETDTLKKKIKRHKAWSQEMRYLKLAIMTVCLFYICWIPYSTCGIIGATGRKCGSNLGVKGTLFVLAYSNSLLNPFVYFFHMRHNVKRLFFKRNKVRLSSTVNSTSTREESSKM